MRSISRNINEGFRVGCVTVSVDLISNGKVRLIIGTPKGIPIHRLETYRVLFKGRAGSKPRNSVWKLKPKFSQCAEGVTYDAIVREANEGVVIGDNVLIRINDIGRDNTKFGIRAPEDVEIALIN
ncbi:MAG TPA: carbon storage regulator [Sedimentisphaerales bacterium]|nr:carbon storage regulator [Sedimentisphaerales bacterium]